MQSYLRFLFFGLGLLGFVSQTKAQVFTPAAGSNQIDCGLNTTLCDHAGCSTDYSANVDGFTVVQVIGIGSVALSGSYTLGAGDTIFVYYGAGIGSAPVNTLTANGTYSLTGTVGQQVTVRFKSDGATQGTGFSFNVVYSGTCVLPGTNFTATGSQSFPCATNALFYDNGGGGANYTDGVSSTVVLNNAGVGVYSLSGTYDLESTFDFVRIYRGVGTGGTLLQTYTGAGSINFNSQPGETITIQFTSDGSVTRTGFAINTTHYGGCSCPPNPLSATATPNIICSGQNSQLLANGVANIANYRISQPAYSLLPCSGTSSGAGPSGDDQVSATVALPFPFVFFGNTYTQFGISTNANIQLGAGPYSAVYTPSGTGIPNTGIDNIIALNFADWLADAGDINWYVQGTAPNRRVVVCFNTLKPYPSSSTGDFTGQIVLYEGTNEIDLVITTSTMGSGASTINLQTQGIQDAPGVGVPVPGRNSVNWTTSNNTMRFTPTLNYTYNWAPATFLNSTSIPNPLATAMTSSQNYTVTASLGALGVCPVTSTAPVTVTTIPSPTIAGTAVICVGQSTTLTASGGFTYLWSTGATTAAITVNPASNTTYSVTANPGGCSATASRIVTVNPSPSVAVSASALTICAPQNVTITATGASTYSWSSGQNTAVITVSPTATTVYTVTGTTAGCTSTASTTITVNVLTVTCPSNVTVAECNAVVTFTTPAATADVCSPPCTQAPLSTILANFNTNGTAIVSTISNRFNFALDGTNGATGTSINDGGSDMYDIPGNQLNTNLGTTIAYTGGVVTANANFGVGGSYFTQKVDNMFVMVADINNLTSFFTTGNNGADSGGSVDGFTFSFTVGCQTYNAFVKRVYGAGDPSINQIMIVPANAGASQTFATDTNDGLHTLSGISSSTRLYYLLLGGTSGYLYTNAELQNAAQTFMTQVGASVGSAGSGLTTVTQASGLTSGSTFPVGTNTISFRAMSASGASATCSSTIVVTPNATVTTQPTNRTACAGDILTFNTAVSNGASFQWEYRSSAAGVFGDITNGIGNAPGYLNTVAGATTTTLTLPLMTIANAVSGMQVRLRVTGSNGCVVYSNIATITINALPTPSVTGTNVICNGQSTTLTASGASTYAWSSGQNTAVITVAPTTNTTYTVTATNASSCTATANRTVTVNALPTPAVAGINTICNGQSTTLTASGANTYAWSSGQNTAAITVAPTANTTYTVTATDVNGCTATASRTVTVNTLPTPAVAGTNVICNGQSTTLTASGASSYAWSSGQNTAAITVAPTTNTTYTVTATDANGCTATANRTVTVNALPTPTVAGINTICNGQSTTLTASGANTYAWSSGQNTAAITVAPTANTTYTVTATDANGCTATANRTVTVNALPTPAITGTNVICNGQSTTLSATGGTSYVWSNGQTITPVTVFPTVNTTYTLTATNAAGCTATASRTVTVNTLPTPAVAGSSVICNGQSSVLTASGGNTYIWSSGQNTAVITVTPSVTTIYDVTVTDLNGCTATANRFVNVNALPTPTVAGINTICNGQSTTLTASGANTYAWSSGQNTAVITVAPTANTTYTVTATDANGCTATANRTVTVNALPTPAVAGINTICNGQSTTLTASGASSYVWSSGQNTAVITVAPTANTTYTVTATDANGCTATANRTVTVNPLPTPTINSSSFIVCDNSSMTITATGGSTYSWSSGQNTAVITVSPTANITYTVTATSAAGCTATTSQAVTVNQSSTVPSIPVMVSTVCPNTNTVLTASGGTAGTGSVIRWYSGANGTGLLGTGASLTVSPASNTVYYARREGACNNSSDASVTVTTKTFIYALHGTTTNTYCTDNFGWSHFYVGDEIILSVQGNFSGAATGFPRATIYDNGTYRQSPGTNPVPNCIISGLSTDEKFEMARAWDFNLGTGGTPVGTYNVRFYYKPAERTAIETAAANWMSTYASCGYSYKYATPLGFYWFKNTLGTYVPPLYDGLHLTGTTGTAGATNYGQFNGITSFSGGSGAVILTPTVILPITYLQFTGENRGKYNHLDWITVQELNNEYFEVERSIDGVNFVKIGEVLAQRGGAQNQERAYAFDDMNPAIGTNYYRLRQVDTDRSSSLSQIVALDLVDNNTNYQFFPNPTENTVNYQIRTLQAEDVDIMVLDMLGRQLSLKTYKSVAGFNNFSVDLSNFAAGSYVVKALHKNSKVQHVSVIIKTSR